jgi:hypothetical protein
LISDRHEELLSQLRCRGILSWGERVLFKALTDLASSLADRDGFSIIDAWADVEDTVRFVYHPSWGAERTVGLVRVRREAPLPYYVYECEDRQTPEEYGENIALIDVGPPLGHVLDRLTFDDQSIGWWGDGYSE